MILANPSPGSYSFAATVADAVGNNVQATSNTVTVPTRTRPTLVLRPTAGHASSFVYAMGSGFAANEAVRVTWDTPSQLLGTVTTSQGSFSGLLGFRVPGHAAGLHAYGHGHRADPPCGRADPLHRELSRRAAA